MYNRGVLSSGQTQQAEGLQDESWGRHRCSADMLRRTSRSCGATSSLDLGSRDAIASGHQLEAHLQAVRRQHEAVSRRCAETDRMLREQNLALKAEHVRRTLDNANKHRHDGESQLTISYAALQEERSHVAKEWRRIREIAARADDRFAEARALEREQVTYWMDRAASSKSVDRSVESAPFSQAESNGIGTRNSIERIEDRERDRLHDVAVAANERIQRATRSCREQVANWEANVLSEEEMAAEVKRQLKARQEQRVLERRLRFEKMEAQARLVLSEECREEEVAWLTKVAKPAWQLKKNERLEAVRHAKEQSALREATAEAHLEGEIARMEANSEVSASACLEQERMAVETCIREEADTLQEQRHTHEAECSRKRAAMRHEQEEVHIRRLAMAQRETRALEEQISEACRLGEESASLELNELVQDQQRLEESLAASEIQQSEKFSKWEALHKEEEERRLRHALATIDDEASVCRDALKNRISLVEIARDEALLFARKSETHNEELMQEYMSRINDLMEVTAELDGEKAKHAELEEERKQSAEEERRRTSWTHEVASGSNSKQAISRAAALGIITIPNKAEFINGVQAGAGMRPKLFPIAPAALTNSRSDADQLNCLSPRGANTNACRNVAGPMPSSRETSMHDHSSDCLWPALASRNDSNDQERSDSYERLCFVPRARDQGASQKLDMNRKPSLASVFTQPQNGQSIGREVERIAAAETTRIAGPCTASYSACNPSMSTIDGDVSCIAENELAANCAAADALEGPPKTRARAWPAPALASPTASSPPASPPAPSALSYAASAAAGAEGAARRRTGPIPAVYDAAIQAVERYGWQRVHPGSAEWTALHWAASEGRTDVCARLLKAKGDPRQPDHLGRAALDYAYEAGHNLTWRVLAGAFDDSPEKAKLGFSIASGDSLEDPGTARDATSPTSPRHTEVPESPPLPTSLASKLASVSPPSAGSAVTFGA